MHEMAVTMSMLDLVLEEAAKAGAGRVTKVNLVLGAMTGVVDRCVETNFELLSKSTPAEGAVLAFRNVPSQARCRRCGHVFPPADLWACPRCQSAEFELIAGDELYVESIEVN
jgi:hydrogenase nickel incorporation protein HypA/HybF